MNIYYGREFNAVFTLNFIAHNPYWRLKHELPYVRKGLTSGNILKIKNKGNANCYPLIKITPNGTQSTIKFNFNDLQVTLSNVDKPFYIDCELERCYEIINGEKKISLTKYVSDKYGNFPYMWYDKQNIFQLIQGNIAEIEMELRTRII